MNVRSLTRKAIITTVSLLITAALVGFLWVTGIHNIRHEQVLVLSREAELAATISIPRWGSGPFPAIVCVHGSGPGRADDLRIVWRNLVPEGVVVLTYDKPGVGESTGNFREVRTDSSEQQLKLIADDVLAAREVLKKHPLIDPERVGLFGGSQAGWIIPLAADAKADIPFSVILSGPATSYGLEMYFSSLTGERLRPGSGLSSDEIEQKLDEYTGMTGYEPLPVLSRSKTPTLWLFGEQDSDIPARRSAMILNKLKTQGAPFTIKVYPNADHNLQDHSTGKPLNIWPDIIRWLDDHHVLK